MIPLHIIIIGLMLLCVAFYAGMSLGERMATKYYLTIIAKQDKMIDEIIEGFTGSPKNKERLNDT